MRVCVVENWVDKEVKAKSAHFRVAAMLYDAVSAGRS
jgi:hypothetical protein